MADFMIPQGKNFLFNIHIVAPNSFLAQDLTNIDIVNSSIVLMDLATLTPISGNITITKLPDDPTITPPTYLNGNIQCLMDNAYTSGLAYERGAKEDGYYIKSTYQMCITIKFTDSTPDIVTIVDSVKVMPTGVN